MATRDDGEFRVNRTVHDAQNQSSIAAAASGNFFALRRYRELPATGLRASTRCSLVTRIGRIRHGGKRGAGDAPKMGACTGVLAGSGRVPIRVRPGRFTT